MARIFLSPILFGPNGDANLYRAAADQLKTDNIFLAANNIQARSGGAAQVYIGNRGPAGQAGIDFGSAGDTNLYRSAADTLKTDDSLVVGGTLTVGVGGGAAKGLLRNAYR